MNCRKCKHNGKDVEMDDCRGGDIVKSTNGTTSENGFIYSGELSKYIKYNEFLKCPECGWSISV